MTKKETAERRQTILELFDGVVHPETGSGLAASGFVDDVSVSNGAVDVVLKFRRVRDPFAASLRRQTVGVLSEAFPDKTVYVEILSSSPSGAVGNEKAAPSDGKQQHVPGRLPGVKRIVAVASGKGGVGKSTVAANLAVMLAAEGYRVGILDADIYGPSQPTLFGVSDYVPVSQDEGAAATIVPAKSAGVEIMSIGFFISPSDALVWRGPMASNALRQLIHQTAWGELDWLLVDLPPGTGDVHLSLVQELRLDGVIIVSTPGDLALADVRRGVEMFRSEGMNVPVWGLIENMAWFSPAELPDNRYFIFGEGRARMFAEEAGIDFLGDIPIVLAATESGSRGKSVQSLRPEVAPYYRAVLRKIVDKVAKDGR